MTKKFLLILTLMLTGGASLVLAQDITVKGTVKDSGGETIIGANILVKGTSTGVATDIDGNYSISAPRNGTLVVSYIGYVTQEVRVNSRSAIDVVLLTNEQELEEVVVIGYGTQSRRTVTASVASVSGERFKDIPAPNAEAALQGRASGVSIITPNGGVGQAPIVRVRGVSSITSGTEPLYVVDGIPIATGNTSYSGNVNALADINPADILTMDVLKDAAAAALYGSRAANGVVLITTRKGQADRTKITYDGWMGVTQATNKIPVMNAAQYVEFKNLSVANRYGTDERSITSGYVSPYGNKAYNLWTLPGGGYVDTDWSKVIYQTGLQHNHSVSASGGSKKLQYYISANYTNQDGMVVKDHYQRLGGAANVTANATDWLSFGINLNGTTSTTSYVDGGRKGSQYSTKNFSRMAMILPPNIPVYHPETGEPYIEERGGIGYGPNTMDNGYYNPQAIIDYGDIYKSEIARIISSYFAELKPISGLSIKTQLGIDYMLVADEAFYTPLHGDGFPLGDAAISRSIRKATTWTNTAQYNFSVGDNNFNVLAGMESYSRSLNRAGADRDDILNTQFRVYQADYANIYPYSNALEESSLLSYLGRVNWDYNAKYMASVNFRRDGFSALSPKNRWGNFGGASAAWRISQESFFEPFTDIFSDLKIKGSWGIVGNTNIGAYAAKSYYQSGYYGSEGQYYISSVADTENLKWESSTKLDIGFTAQLFRNIDIEFDYYRNDASDLILDVPVAWSKGIPSNKITTNAGAMRNTGIEFSISATPYQTKDFSWFTSFNITTQTNEVIKLTEGVSEIRGGNDYNTTQVGYSIGQLFIRPSAGIDPQSGRRVMIGKDGTEVLVMFEKTGTYFRKDDYLRDGTLTPYAQSDIVQQIAGGTMPTYYGGWTNDFKYKNFDLSLLLQYSGGNWIYNGGTATLSDMRNWNNSIDVYENAWRKVGDNAKYAMPIYGDNTSNGSAQPITDWVERGDYLRFKTLTIGYTFNTKVWSQKVGISSLRLYAGAQNLFCLTGYSGLDPESLISSNDQAALQGGVDKNSLPQAKTYTFGVNVTF
jgi:TonB-linked SusC/RagA family outer membrane protein